MVEVPQVLLAVLLVLSVVGVLLALRDGARLLDWWERRRHQKEMSDGQ